MDRTPGGFVVLMSARIDTSPRGPTPNGVRAGLGRRTGVIVGAAVCGLFLYYALTWPHFVATVGMCRQLFCDFVDYYFPMGESIFDTARPVTGFLYSPVIAIVLALFRPLELDAALVVWGILQALGVITCLLLFRRLVPAGVRVWLLFAVLQLSFFPLAFNFLTGQVSVFIMAATLGALLLYDRGHRIGAAILLAFAVSFKFYPLLFLAPAIARRDIRFVVWTVLACATFLFVVPALLLSADGAWGFYEALLHAFRDTDWVVASAHSHYAPHVVLRLAEVVGIDAHGHLAVMRWVALAVAAINMGLAYWIQRARLRLATVWSFQLVFLSIPFVLKSSWPHDFIFLPVAQGLLAWWLIDGDRVVLGTNTSSARHDGGKSARARSIVRMLLILSVAISNIVFFNLFGVFDGYSFCAFLFWSNLMLLLATYIVLFSPALRSIRALNQ